MRQLAATAREAVLLTAHLHHPPLGTVLRRSAVVLLVVAFAMAYLYGIDSLCSKLPRLIAAARAARAAGGGGGP